MGYFPFFIDIKNKEILVIGGGKIAYRKIRTLLEFDVKITVISLDFCKGIVSLFEDNKINIIRKAFEIKDLNLKNFFCVISATDNEEINSEVAEECFKRNILVNVADDIEKCNFTFPAIVKRDSLVVGVSTSGNSPTMSSVIKAEIEETIPDYYGKLIEDLGIVRENIGKSIIDEDCRKRILKIVTDLSLERKSIIADEELERIIHDVLAVKY